MTLSNGLELYPKLRFPEFTEPWNSFRVSDIFAERLERGNQELPLLSVTINDGVIPRTDIDGKDNSSDDKSNYKIVYEGDMVYNSMRMWQGANGIAPMNGIVSPAYTVLKSKSPINTEFFAALFKNQNMINKFRCNSQGMTSDTWNLKYPQISTIKLCVASIEEQDKIAQFLSLLNKRIAKQQELVENLKKYKRGLIQKYFEENYKWEKIAFWDCVEIASSLIDPTEPPYNNMKHVGTANIEKYTGRLLPCKKAYEEGLTSGKYFFTKKCVIYSKIRPELSKVALPDFDGICSADAYPLRVRNNIMPELIYYELLSERFIQFAKKTSARTKMPKINQEELSSFNFLVPPIDIQEKLVGFLLKIDNLLLLEDQKLIQTRKYAHAVKQLLFI